MEKQTKDKSSWAVGGGLLTGLGIGFFFLQTSALAFIGSIITGLGVGLLLAAVLGRGGSEHSGDV